MIRFLFVITTLLVGSLFQIFLGRYLSLYEASPQVFLILTVINGFLFGPVMGEVLGFSWGLISDASGTRMFGMNAVLLALVGFLAGTFRRRVASERLTAQVAISVIATLLYAVGGSTLYSLFDESPGHFSIAHLILVIAYNAVFIPVFFYLSEYWASLWRIPQEHM